MKLLKIFAFILFCLITVQSHAQRDLTLYFMNSVVQSDMTNPSVLPQSTFSTGVPLLTSTNFSFINSGFVVSDIKAKSDGNIDFENILSKLDDKNFMSFDFQTELLTARFKVKNLYLGISLIDKLSFRLGYPKDLLQFVFNGNAAFIGTTAQFEGTTFDASYYHELGLSGGYQLGKFTVGARLKYLRGVANVNTDKSTFSFYTDPDNYNITFSSDILINTSGIAAFDDKNMSVSNFVMGSGNNGFATDLGASFKLNEKFSFSASIIDVGFINWNAYPKNYLASNKAYTYDGVKLNNFAKSDNLNFNTAIDSMKAAFKTDETKNPYSTTLTTKTYIGGIFTLNEKVKFGALFFNEYYKEMKPAMTLSYVGNYGKKFQLALSYTATLRSYNNIGLGWAWNMGSTQIYSTYDNLLGMFMLHNAKLFNVRFGANLVFGRKKD